MCHSQVISQLPNFLLLSPQVGNGVKDGVRVHLRDLVVFGHGLSDVPLEGFQGALDLAKRLVLGGEPGFKCPQGLEILGEKTRRLKVIIRVTQQRFVLVVVLIITTTK